MLGRHGEGRKGEEREGKGVEGNGGEGRKVCLVIWEVKIELSSGFLDVTESQNNLKPIFVQMLGIWPK